MCFAARWNGFAGRMWSAGRSLENTDTDYEEEWWQHTPMSESNTNAEQLWFNYVDTDTIFWAGIQLIDGQKGALVNTVYPQHPENTSKLFTRNPTIYFPEVDKTCIDVFGMIPRFHKNLLENGNLLCRAATKTALATIQLWFNCFHGILAYTLPGWLSKEMQS